MKSFAEFIEESISINQINKTPGKNKVVVFMGRFQPPTKAHLEILKTIHQETNLPVVIAIVKGAKSSLNKTKNPFDYNLQKTILLHCLNNNYQIIQVSSGFIGEFVDILRNQGKEPVILYCGSDRLAGYEKQVNRYKSVLNLNLSIKEIPRSNSSISATKVRHALLNDDFEQFKQLTAKCEWQYYDQLKSIIQKELKQ